MISDDVIAIGVQISIHLFFIVDFIYPCKGSEERKEINKLHLGIQIFFSHPKCSFKKKILLFINCWIDCFDVSVEVQLIAIFTVYV